MPPMTILSKKKTLESAPHPLSLHFYTCKKYNSARNVAAFEDLTGRAQDVGIDLAANLVEVVQDFEASVSHRCPPFLEDKVRKEV